MNINKNLFNELIKYNTARIDIKNHGNSTNNIEVLDYNDQLIKIYNPHWFNKGSDGVGTVIESYQGKLDLELKCVGDGNLKIELRTIDFKDKNNHKLPIFLDYTYFFVDGEEVIKSTKTIWHNKPIRFNKRVVDGERIFIYIEWKPASKNSEYK